MERSLPAVVLGAMDDLINNFIDPPSPLRPAVDPRHVLSNNFAPVADELPPTECEVEEGSPLPACLHGGAYIRNGPNPQFLPRGPYHLFDGDGMLHAIRISPGGTSATLCSRYVRTYKYTLERDAAAPVLPNVFSSFDGGIVPSAARAALAAARFLAGQFDPIANGIGLANTSLALLAGRLYAMGESDLPYAVRVTPGGDIETLGREDFGAAPATMMDGSMTAHPKMDPSTGEAFAFRYAPIPPFLTYFWFDPRGRKQPDVPIFSLPRPTFLHDFAITQNYAIFGDIQIGVSGPTAAEIIGSGGARWTPVRADPGKVPRIGVLPRYARDESEMRWYDVVGFNMIHAINAWEEDGGDAVVLVAPNILSLEHTLERMDLIHASVEMVRVELKTGRVTRRPLSASNLDFGVINPAYVGRKNRYVYAGVGGPMPKIKGVVKLDVAAAAEGGVECTVASRMFGDGCYGGEPFFVASATPRSSSVQLHDQVVAEEDDGYVLCYVHNEKSGESRFLVMDAKSPQLNVVGAIKLPRRVPYGFHGLFVSEAHLKALR